MIPTKAEWIAALNERHGEDLQKKFSSAVVAVCGLGGLGSNVAIALARAGIGKLILIDFDKVDITNLHRQQYKASQIGKPKTAALSDNLLEIAPYIALETHNVKIDEQNATDFFKDADIICEAFDNPEAKAILVNAVLEKAPEKYLIAASGMAGLGDPNLIHTKKITDKFYLSGDEVSDTKDGLSLFAPRVALCAAHQASTALRILSLE